MGFLITKIIMSTRAINLDTWDWEFGQGLQNYKSEQNEIVQNILTTLKSWKDDCFFDLDYGISWGEILGSFNTSQLAKKDISTAILGVDGVERINDLQLLLNENRTLTITLNISTIYDTIQINEDFSL